VHDLPIAHVLYWKMKNPQQMEQEKKLQFLNEQLIDFSIVINKLIMNK